jgi:UDPglucose--hexose-1-phosphate uridylyltransferase
VFKNKYPLVDDHEIIVHSPDPLKDIEDLSQDQNVRIIRAFLNRVSYYNSHDKEVMIFNNRGGKAGASITHPHSQIVALKGFPGIIEREKSEGLKYFNEHNSCFWCDKIKLELAQKSRVVYESSHFVLLVPQACRWSYEMLLIPKEHKPNFEFINEMEINDFAFILKAALLSYDNLFQRPDRNFWIHTMRYEPYHWHVGFIPQTKVLGGLELGAGIWVSDKATPEDAAGQLAKAFSEVCSVELH